MRQRVGSGQGDCDWTVTFKYIKAMNPASV